MNVNTTEGGNLPPSQPQQVEDVESNNSDLVVKLNFADLDALANDDDPNGKFEFRIFFVKNRLRDL